MKKLNYLLGMLFMAAAFTYCTDKNNESEIKAPTTAEFAEIRQGFLEEITQYKTFDAATGLNFTSSKGVRVEISGSGLTLSGQSVTGDVQLRYIELFDIGSIALANKPLLGKDYSNNKPGPLVTGGEFFIEVTQNGTPLDGYASLQVPVAFTKGADPDDMEIWSMDDGEEWGVWEKAGGEIWQEGQGTENHYYCWLPFNWTNIDWLYSLPGTQTQIRVKVPDGYNKGNCSVYAAYFDMPGTLAAFDVYDATDKYFTEHTGIAPVGYKMFVIFVSGDAQTKRFVYATKLVTVEPDQYITFTAEDLRSASIQQVIDAINGLYD